MIEPENLQTLINQPRTTAECGSANDPPRTGETSQEASQTKLFSELVTNADSGDESYKVLNNLGPILKEVAAISPINKHGAGDADEPCVLDPFHSTRSPNVVNADNAWLGTMNAGPCHIGAVDEINGAGAEEVPEFKPTRHELLQLAKYWGKQALEIEFDWFLFEQTGSTEIRRLPFAWRRVSRIADLVGKQAVDQAIEEVKKAIGEAENPRYWQVFLSGTEAEREDIRRQIQPSSPSNRDCDTNRKPTHDLHSVGAPRKEKSS